MPPGGGPEGKKKKPPKRKQSIQLPRGKTKCCMLYPKRFPLDILGSIYPLEDTDPPGEALLPSLMSEKAKGKQPAAPKSSAPAFKTRCALILRIPCARDGPLKRVWAAVRGDAATHHWQTFFFKNIVCLEPYWGVTNDKAFVATRIVRLKIDERGKKPTPTPYFLMVCIGEYPRITSPPNDNAMFVGLHEPIYNDAFVFKLGDPELDVNGYANYVNIDKDIVDFSWLKPAVRNAAKKVERSMAMHANPGFPDMSNYADEETMSDDVGKMLYVQAKIRNAKQRHLVADDVHAISERPDFESMYVTTVEMMEQITTWKDDGLLPYEDDESVEYQAVDTCFQKAKEALDAIEEARLANKWNETPSASTDVESPSAMTKAKELCKWAQEVFIDAESAYVSVQALVNSEMDNKTRDAWEIRDHSAQCDTRWLKLMADSVLASVVEMKRNRRVIAAIMAGHPLMKKIDQLGAKAQAAYQAIEENKPYQEIIRLVIELNKLLQIFSEGLQSQS